MIALRCQLSRVFFFPNYIGGDRWLYALYLQRRLQHNRWISVLSYGADTCIDALNETCDFFTDDGDDEDEDDDEDKDEKMTVVK